MIKVINGHELHNEDIAIKNFCLLYADLQKLKPMPVKSYLIVPHSDQKLALVNEVRNIPGCEIHPAENQEVLVLVTDTSNEDEEQQLFRKVENNKKIRHITLVSGYE